MPLHGLAELLGDYAGFGPGAFVALVVSVAAAPAVATRLRTRVALAWVLVFSVGIVLAATVTPSREAILFGTVGSGACDLGRMGIAPLGDLRHLNETSLNVLLFVPLGLALGLLPPSRSKVVLIVAALLLPIAIEAFQLAVTQLDRKCQSGDVFDNLTGLVPALAIGIAARRAAGGSRSRRQLDAQDRPDTSR